MKDIPIFFENIIPSDKNYHHDETWRDGNGFSHLRSALLGSSLTVPFTERKLALGTWQQVVLLNFDNKKRERKVIVQLIGVK